ncbi:similar to Saccharomyces cerevisiae YGR090W UTP22 Possible U3 snoRNP protein involved in maturation of pre-18S rRNA [Maudiozyma saulgeensis]|uniref:U3 small nucleolar RNA-associated protein 22 n=1 Tax=Maudiozyma saulgeensis TaxID=1789683 RepID=A0A1X7QXS7_9SACH|nr:similar to Saccharomyces cerevisiae YGR090W UTP22 Possible U3 snoRNP protein involved in maturation of pre-18S rRNA [Kazachstania saulgeensis]
MAPTKRNISQIIEDDTNDQIVSGQKKTFKKNDYSQGKDSGSDTDNSENEEEEEDEETTHKSKNVSGSTAAYDIHVARETAELFQSNIFKLQIDELVEQVKLNDKHVLKVEKFLHRFYDLIQQIPDWEEKNITETLSYFKGKSVSIPFVDPKPAVASTNYKFNYKAPEVSLIGSFALKTGIYQPQGSSIDVLLTMPKELFEKKDFLNLRCLHKRSVYLAYFTYHLKDLLAKDKLDEFLTIEYSYLHDDPLLPILTLKCKASDEYKHELNFYKTKFSINLIIGFPYKIFESKKLLPNKNCIRIAKEDNDTPLPATSLYNYSVLSASAYESYLKYLYKCKKQTEAFREASILGRLWLQQRGFSSKISQSGGLGGFGTFEFSILMTVLLNGGGENGNKILLHGFSSYQLFKGVIKYLATMDICTEGHLQFHSDITYTAAVSKYVREGFQTPTIFDKSTKINILSKLSVSNYNILKFYAKETLSMLNDVVQDRFSNIFLTNIGRSDQLKYDLCYDLKFPTNGSAESDIISKFTATERIKYITIENFLVHKIISVIKYALSDRITNLEVQLVGHRSTFATNKRKPLITMSPGSQFNFDHIRIKLLINQEESEKLITKGPLHSEQASHASVLFKSFWGPKSSLRRFKDGSINHCCLWTTSSSEPVISSIVPFIISRHISEAIHVDNIITKKFQNLLPLPNLAASSKTSVLNMTSFFNIKKSFDDLYKIIFRMKLPLSVKSILPVDTSFRYTSLCQPVPFAYSDPKFFQNIILEFETSQKWPDEITSLEKAKTAFLLKIEEQLTSEHGTKYKSFFARDESIPFNLDVTTLNILTPEGYGFKFRILTERDEVLYLRAISNARKEATPALENTFLEFTSTYLASIRHTRTIENISHSYQFYSPVVRLFKKWLDCHLLMGHLKDELIELIAMKPFTDHYPYCIPGSVENGFLKILKFIAQWNWKDEPLILDLVKPDAAYEDQMEVSIGGSEINSETMKKLSEKLTLAQYKAIQSNFRNLRKDDPNGIHLQFFVASKNDPSGILYSSNIPLAIATRLTALAKVAVNLIQTHGLNSQTIDLLFAPGLKDYDFVVHLKVPNKLKISSGIITQSEFKNLTNIDAPSSFPTDLNELSQKMDPTYQLVKYLNMKYKNTMIFSSHKYIGVNGGTYGNENVITGLIKPLYKKQMKFKVNMDCNTKPVDAESVILNKESIYHEIAAFSSDLIVKFDLD